MTRALVVGAGSIGTRHGEVLRDLGCEVAFVTSRADLAHPSFGSFESGVHEFQPDYVVIANETERHSETVERLALTGFNGRVLVEKPLATAPSIVERARFSHLGVGYNLRFHPLIVALAQALEGRSLLTTEVYAGQHLSTWRPSRHIREQYSSTAARGGGVLRDLSHELDYLDLLLGSCRGVFARGGRLGDVTVDSDDAWGIVARYERAAIVTVQLNYLDTQTRRRIVVNTGDSTIEADFLASTLRVDDNSTHFPTDRNASYLAMHRAMLSDDSTGVASAAKAAQTDALILMIERSASEQIWIEP